MAQTTDATETVDRLLHSVSHPVQAARGDFYLAVASLFRLQAPRLTDSERAIMRDVLLGLARDVEMAVRIALAERLADDPEVPLELISLLADDAIEVARPVILRSKRLSDRDIVEFLTHADELHQAACAERPGIGEPITGMLARSDSETVLVPLVRNATAKIGKETFETLVEKSCRIVALHEPLAHRSDLPVTLAERMCGWVCESIRSYIVKNHKLDSASIEMAVDLTRRRIQSRNQRAGFDGGGDFIEKLAHAGKLKAGFLLRVLQLGQMPLFDRAFAKMLDIDTETFREAFYHQGVRPVAIACRAVGLDRSVVATVYSLSRKGWSSNVVVSSAERVQIKEVFGTLSRQEASEVVRQPRIFGLSGSRW